MISVKTTSRNNWIASVEVSPDKIESKAMTYVNHKLVPSPLAGKDLVRIHLFGSRGGPKDTATFSKAQAKELATALLHIAEEINE